MPLPGDERYYHGDVINLYSVPGVAFGVALASYLYEAHGAAPVRP